MRVKTGSSIPDNTPVEIVTEYHDRTKHRLDKYAEGPEFLDWDLQPSPYRYFEGIEKTALQLDLGEVSQRYQDLYSEIVNNTDILPVNLSTIGLMLGLSMGLSAHKEYMGDQWAVRCNPSSGNLHPTEAYLITANIEGVKDGVFHYLSEDHTLQQRFIPDKAFDGNVAMMALSSIHWREAWKYGERAFRYCQLDVGHALAALSYAAGCLGWELKVQSQWTSSDIIKLCGLDRDEDYHKVERENPDLLVAISPVGTTKDDTAVSKILPWINVGKWQGQANLLDKHPMYHWPVISQVEKITEISAITQTQLTKPLLPELKLNDHSLKAKHIIYGRRSAQRYDKQTSISRHELYTILDKCLYRPYHLPWSALSDVFPMFMIFYIHRVTSLTPGLYILSNTTTDIRQIKSQLSEDFLWSRPSGCPEHMPFYLLSNQNTEKFSRTISCHQAIASDGAFSTSMLLEFEKPIQENTANYRKLHWQAGALGHLLYLEAENLGLQGTGIGCFFDDEIHRTLGLKDKRYQVLYNFTLGAALNDSRISTLPAYPHLELNL